MNNQKFYKVGINPNSKLKAQLLIFYMQLSNLIIIRWQIMICIVNFEFLIIV